MKNQHPNIPTHRTATTPWHTLHTEKPDYRTTFTLNTISTENLHRLRKTIPNAIEEDFFTTGTDNQPPAWVRDLDESDTDTISSLARFASGQANLPNLLFTFEHIEERLLSHYIHTHRHLYAQSGWVRSTTWKDYAGLLVESSDHPIYHGIRGLIPFAMKPALAESEFGIRLTGKEKGEGMLVLCTPVEYQEPMH